MPDFYLSTDKENLPVIGIRGESNTMYFFKITDNPKMACLKKGQNFKFFCSEQKRTLYKYNIKNHRDDSEMPLVPKLERLAEEIEKLTEQGLAVTPK